ncbi:hypothetical protein XENOCAPTIV_029241, partial [Xenoophorus captivus]
YVKSRSKPNTVFLLVDWETRRKRKIADITQALNVDPVDVATLRRMAISEGGLLTDEIRCQVPPHKVFANDNLSCPEKVERDNNKDYNQVLLDVQRSLRRFPPDVHQSESEALLITLYCPLISVSLRVFINFRHVVRLYDFFLACHPLMPIYFAAVVSFLSSLLT